MLAVGRRQWPKITTVFLPRGFRDSTGNRLLEPVVAANGVGPVQCSARLGGVLKFYSRAA